MREDDANKSHKTIKQNLMFCFVGIITLFVLLLIVSYFLNSGALKAKKDDSTILNMAGRQRMLIQKYANERIEEIIPLQIRHHAMKIAEIVTMHIMEDRKQYTKNGIGKLERETPDVHPDSNYATIEGCIPLSANFVQETSQVINNKVKYKYSFLSKWNINKEREVSTEFEKEAFDYLTEKNGEAFFRYIVHKNVYTLRYATPDIATEVTCIRCHNSHEDCPKRDFEVGDIMGILVVDIPLGMVNSDTRSFFANSDNREPGVNSFPKSKKVFDVTLGTLLNGGKIPVDFEMTKFETISPMTNPVIRKKLEEVKHLWNKVQEEFHNLTKTELNSLKFIVGFREAYDSVNTAMKSMDEAMILIQTDSQQRLRKIKYFQIFSFSTEGGLFCIIIILFVYIQIVTPLERNRESLEKQTEDFRLLNLELSEAMEKEKKQNWLRIGLSGLNDRMRGAREIASLCQDIIAYLARYVDAQIGTIYLASDNHTLCLAGTYASENSLSSPQTLNFGDGLIGQAVVDKKSCIINNLPDGYIEIRSGLAKMSPRNVLIVPFLYEGDIKGALELGSIHEFHQGHIDFMNLVAENIAIAINTAQSRKQQQELLEEAQAQADEFQAGNDELQSINMKLERYTDRRQIDRAIS